MKIAICSDIHFCQYSSILRSRGKRFSTRLENCIACINEFEQFSEENNCDLEIFCGDFFDKEVLNAEELSALKEINWNNISKKFLVGNHELGNNDLTYNSLNALTKIGDIIDKPFFILDNSCNIFLIPYIVETNRKDLIDYINAFEHSIDKNKPNVIFAHSDISGIQYGMFESKNGFTLSEIENNTLFYLDGHLHNTASYNTKTGNIVLLGNLTGLNFSEDASKYRHFMYLLDTDILFLDEKECINALKFYKLCIDDNNLNIIEALPLNSVVSIKTSKNILDKVKESVNKNKNIIESRITLIPDINIVNNSDISEIVSKDHIQQFKDYILKTLGTSDLIEDEINNL